MFVQLAALFVLSVAVSSQPAPPIPQCAGTFNTIPFSTNPPKLVTRVANGSRWIVGEGNDTINIVHLYGSPYDMGYAYGQMLKNEIADMIPLFYDWVNLQIDQFCQQKIPSLEWLCQLVEKTHTVNLALDLTILMTAKYTPAWYTDELRGIADASGTNYTQLLQLNMFPELIRAACTMSGSWGDAVPGKIGIHQLRALDFGVDGPMAKYPLLTVYHPDGAQGSHPYVNVGWVSLTGVLTGYSSAQLAVSEKVFDGYTGNFSMAGIPWMVALKSIMMFDNSVEAGISRLQAATRTCAIFVGLGGINVGPGITNQFRGLEYTHDFIHVYDDKNYTSNGPAHPQLDGVMYWDKHVQPSGDMCLGTVLSKYYGNLTAETYARVVAPLSQTGDLHIATFDIYNNIMFTSNAKYGNESGPLEAWSRQFVRVDMSSLFSTKNN